MNVVIEKLYVDLRFASEDRAEFFRRSSDPGTPMDHQTVYRRRWEAAKAETEFLSAKIRRAEAGA